MLINYLATTLALFGVFLAGVGIFVFLISLARSFDEALRHYSARQRMENLWTQSCLDARRSSGDDEDSSENWKKAT